MKKQAAGSGRKVRTYEGSINSISIVEGQTVEGVFQGMKEITIKDQETGERKDIRQYRFRDSKGAAFSILGRSSLDDAFDSIFEAEGGIGKVQGMSMLIERKKNKKLDEKRSMGVFVVSILED